MGVIPMRLVTFAAVMFLAAAALAGPVSLAVVCVIEGVAALYWATVLVKARGNNGRA